MFIFRKIAIIYFLKIHPFTLYRRILSTFWILSTLTSSHSEFHHAIDKSSHPREFCKKGALENFESFTGKHLYQSLFFNKVAARKPATLLKKSFFKCLPVNFEKIFKNNFFIEHLWWLHLDLKQARFSIEFVRLKTSLTSRGPYYIETSPLICCANQWIGSYMIGTSVMKELNMY